MRCKLVFLPCILLSFAYSVENVPVHNGSNEITDASPINPFEGYEILDGNSSPPTDQLTSTTDTTDPDQISTTTDSDSSATDQSSSTSDTSNTDQPSPSTDTSDPDQTSTTTDSDSSATDQSSPTTDTSAPDQTSTSTDSDTSATDQSSSTSDTSNTDQPTSTTESPETTTTTLAPTKIPTIPPQEVPDSVIKDDDSNEPCLLASMDLNLTINYDTTNSTKSVGYVVVSSKDSSKNTTGACLGKTYKLSNGSEVAGPVLVYLWDWPEKRHLGQNFASSPSSNEVVVYFHMDSAATSLSRVAASIIISPTVFLDAKDGQKVTTDLPLDDTFTNDVSGAYTCLGRKTIDGEDGISLAMSNVQFEIGTGLSENRFGEGVTCAGAAATYCLLTITSAFLVTLATSAH